MTKAEFKSLTVEQQNKVLREALQDVVLGVHPDTIVGNTGIQYRRAFEICAIASASTYNNR